MRIRALNGGRESATLLLLEPPINDPNFVELRTGDGARTFMHRRVLREAIGLTRRRVPNETGALLMGGTFTDGTCPYTVVTDIVLPLPGEVIGTSSTVEITAAGRRRMEIEGRLRDALAVPVGWMHSHPVQQAFFSGTDRAEHARWTAPASVGLVVSGVSRADPPWRVFLGPEAHEALEWSSALHGAVTGSDNEPRLASVEAPPRRLQRVDAPDRTAADTDPGAGWQAIPRDVQDQSTPPPALPARPAPRIAPPARTPAPAAAPYAVRERVHPSGTRDSETGGVLVLVATIVLVVVIIAMWGPWGSGESHGPDPAPDSPALQAPMGGEANHAPGDAGTPDAASGPQPGGGDRSGTAPGSSGGAAGSGSDAAPIDSVLDPGG